MHAWLPPTRKPARPVNVWFAFHTKYVGNHYHDLSTVGNDQKVLFDLISMPPVSPVVNARIEGPYYELPDGAKIPAGIKVHVSEQDSSGLPVRILKAIISTGARPCAPSCIHPTTRPN